MTFTISSEVMTRNTPGIFFAALVSTDLMRPCATVERKILPCTMFGRRMRCVYSARPVTFSRASRRGTERPIWPPPIGFVAISEPFRQGRRCDDLAPISLHLDMIPFGNPLHSLELIVVADVAVHLAA